jgi:hypothetical protein
LFVTLFWLKNYDPNDVLGELFGLWWGDVCRLLKRTLTALDMALQNEIRWPDEQEMEEILLNFSFHFPEPFNKVGVIIDGTFLRITRSSDSQFQKRSYNPFRRCHCFNVQIACTPDGRIIFGSDPITNPSDQAIWNELQLREKFRDKDYAILGDSGYTFNPKEPKENEGNFSINALSPFTRRGGHELTEKEKEFNKILSTIRAVVENINAQLKHWRIFKGVFRHYSTKKNNTVPVELVVRVVLKLTARFIELHPIRHES